MSRRDWMCVGIGTAIGLAVFLYASWYVTVGWVAAGVRLG